MTRLVTSLVATLLAVAASLPAAQAADQPVAIAIHGGAGTISRSQMTAEREKAYLAALKDAVETGHRILESGGSSLDAVTEAVRLLEDSPLFNAGKGAVFTHDGRNELDAAIMDGATLNAGAVAGLHHVRNPIQLARAVMEKSAHVFMVGDGAEEFALEQGITLVPRDYFYTEERWQRLQRARERERAALPQTDKFGTVGAVALDRAGNLAAATSTGGLTNKRYGRIGDVPVIGAGTYANNAACAISATGDGEYFIRSVVAYDIAARMMYADAKLEQAATEVIGTKLVDMGGGGGVIGVDRYGNVAMVMNTPGMYRASIDANGQRVVRIFAD
jgi:beta-aspartyl-peptidase (threonine type)